MNDKVQFIPLESDYLKVSPPDCVPGDKDFSFGPVFCGLKRPITDEELKVLFNNGKPLTRFNAETGEIELNVDADKKPGKTEIIIDSLKEHPDAKF